MSSLAPLAWKNSELGSVGEIVPSISRLNSPRFLSAALWLCPMRRRSECSKRRAIQSADIPRSIGCCLLRLVPG